MGMGDLDCYFRIENEKHQSLYALYRANGFVGFQASLLAIPVSMSSVQSTLKCRPKRRLFASAPAIFIFVTQASMSGVDPTEHLL